MKNALKRVVVLQNLFEQVFRIRRRIHSAALGKSSRAGSERTWAIL
jgi:hypothetical protein